MTAKKNAWRKPELVVLVRGRAEESVLVACKHSGDAAGPVVGYETKCNKTRCMTSSRS